MPTETSKAKRNHIADIRCTSCGAPADYDIRTGGYACSYCGGKVEINLGGSAAWFCIFVPVIPIYLLKFGRIDMYDRPWFYSVSENGTRIRYRGKRETPSGKETLKIAGRLLFGWPIGLAVWFGILAFLTMCGLTAGIL